MASSSRFRLALLVAVLGLGASPGCVAPLAEPAVQTDVLYGTAGGQELRLDVYPCATPGPHPWCLLIHGGGWRAGSKSDEKSQALTISRQGVVCFAVDYRLAPKYTYPAQVLDCARAVRWVRAHAAEYGVDPERSGAWGSSAGAHLSLMLGVIKPGEYQSDDDPNRALSAKVKCVVDFFGPTDLRGASFSSAARNHLVPFIGAPPNEAPEAYADASPITHVTKDASPVLFVHGARDVMVPLSESEAMKAALDGAGVENQLIVVKGGGHGLRGAAKDDIDAALRSAERWLVAHLKG